MLTPPDLARETDEVRRAQSAIPPGASILENVEAAYGFDWRRNRVLIADYPGMASPPPGMPLTGTPEDLRRMLVASGVQYLIFDRRLFRSTDFADFVRQPQVSVPALSLLRLWHPPQLGGYSRMEYYISNRTRDLFAGIAGGQPVLFDDGRLQVVRLDRNAP